MKPLTLRGVLTALVTPLTHKGIISWTALGTNLAFQQSQGVFGVVPVGTTGESATLEWPRHADFIRRVTGLVGQRSSLPADKRLFVLAGTGSNSTKEALRSSVLAVGSTIQADGVLLVDCYYNKPSSLQLLKYYHEPTAKAVFEENPQALVVPYIIPGRTCCQLHPAHLAVLVQNCPNVRAVKEATGDLVNMELTRRMVNEVCADFSIMSGDDGLTAQMMRSDNIAASGVISVMSNIVPRAIANMVAAYAAGDRVTGDRLNEKLKPLFNLVGITSKDRVNLSNSGYEFPIKYPNPCAIKTMMAGLGMDTGKMLPPLGPMNADGVAQVRRALRTVWHDSPEILTPIETHYKVNIEERLAADSIWEELAAA
ncbi:MAG: dihydrodipicolinate synthase family protein [Patescibacteria group bacterium]